MNRFYSFKHFALATLVLVAMPFAANAAQGDQFEVNNLKFEDLGNNEAALISNGYRGSISVPAAVENNGTTYAVTTIGNGEDVFCGSVTNVILPEGITTLKSYAFSFPGISALTLPSTLTTLNMCSFFGVNVPELALPDGVTSIPAMCFYACMGVSEISLGDNITSIGQQAFTGCSGLTSLIIKTTEPPVIDPAAFGSDGMASPANVTVTVPTGCKEAYETAWAELGFKEFVEGDFGGGSTSVNSIKTSTRLTYTANADGIMLSDKNLGGTANIYTIAGNLAVSAPFTDGYIPASLPQGIYLLNINGTITGKIIIK